MNHPAPVLAVVVVASVDSRGAPLVVFLDVELVDVAPTARTRPPLYTRSTYARRLGAAPSRPVGGRDRAWRAARRVDLVATAGATVAYLVARVARARMACEDCGLEGDVIRRAVGAGGLPRVLCRECADRRRALPGQSRGSRPPLRPPAPR